MSTAVHARVWAAAPAGVVGTALLVLLALADEANDAGAVDTTTETVAAKARTTDRHVRRLLADLDAIDGIHATHWRGRIVAALTAFAVPAPAPTPEPPSDGLSEPDEMSGRIVRTGRNVRNSEPSSPPMVPPFLSPTPPNHTPPLSPPTTPPTPTPIIPDPPTADHAPATAAATGGRHKAPTKPQPKPVTVQAPTALLVLPAADPPDPPPPRVDPWVVLYAAAALDLEGKATAWRHSRTGRALAGYGELAAAIGPSVADDPEAAVEVWRAIVTAKKAERLGDGRPVWTVFSPSNAARLCRRHLQDNPGFAALAVRAAAAAADPRPPIGRIASQRGFTVSRPDTWPADVLAAYPDVAAQWAGSAPDSAATGTDGADLTQATDKRYTSA